MRGPGREGGGVGRDALALASVLSVAPCAIHPSGPLGGRACVVRHGKNEALAFASALAVAPCAIVPRGGMHGSRPCTMPMHCPFMQWPVLVSMLCKNLQSKVKELGAQ